jgi:hypothetical protein
MKIGRSTPAALLLAFFVVAAARAEYWPCVPIRPAPDACGPGYYCTGPCGMVYGPNYCLRPCWPPFNGMLPVPCHVSPGFPQANPNYGKPLPGMPPTYGYGLYPPLAPPEQGPLNSPVFPTHPYARSPRDFFMLDLY